MISHAELAAMPRVTPTCLAEQRYAAGRGGSYPIGPSGLPLPPARLMFRPTVDGPLLDKIGRTAMGAHERRVLSDAQIEDVTARLVADIARRMPADHMAILELYGCAKMHSTVLIDLPDCVLYRLPIQQRLLVGDGHRFTAIVEAPGALAPIPEDTRLFFKIAHGVEVEKTRMRRKLAGWPADFKRRAARWPRWADIEAAWPVIGLWFERERSRGASSDVALADIPY